MTGDDYSSEICNADGTIVNKQPYLIYWPKFGMWWSTTAYVTLHNIGNILDGSVKVRYGDFYGDEKLRMTYEIYEPGKTFYIDEEGKAYIYPGMLNVNATVKWI
jgi:hypothetical protein